MVWALNTTNEHTCIECLKNPSSDVYTITDQIFNASIYDRMHLHIIVIIIMPTRHKMLIIDQKE